MKIIGVAASPRKYRSSHFLLEKSLEEVTQAAKVLGGEVEVELVDLAGKDIGGCLSCDKCKEDLICSQQDDFQELIDTFADPAVRGIILATPVYMGSMTSQAKAFLDRSVLFRRNGFLLKGRVGGVLAVGGSRNGGQELTIQAVHAAMMIHDMIIVGDGGHFGGAAWSNHPDGYQGDKIGIDTARHLGRRITEVVCRMK